MLFRSNMYVLGYDGNKKLTNLNQAIKQNLKTYIGEYRIITDAINLIDGFIVNIGLDFEVVCYSNYNKREVLANCLKEMQDYFNIDNWTFNKPINISEIGPNPVNSKVSTASMIAVLISDEFRFAYVPLRSVLASNDIVEEIMSYVFG